MKTKRDELILKKTFVKGTFVPDKKELCDLIMKDKVSISIISQARYASSKEIMVIEITHL